MSSMTTVLVIDDSLAYLETVSQLLDTLGYDAVLTAEPRRALRLCEDINFDLILCALELREQINSGEVSQQVGVQTITSLREKNPRIPIVVTGSVVSEDLLDAMGRIGVSDTLSKSLPQPAMIKNIARLLGGATE